MIAERNGATTFKGQPLTLVGEALKPGDPAPDFEVQDTNLMPVKLSSFRGKVCIICSVPSLDTPVCDMETRHFNLVAGKLGSDIKVLTISMDLPFAQKRWCGAANINHLSTLSDHKEGNFGRAFGLLIKEWRLLGRAVFIVDKKGIVRFVQYVKELTEQPDYDLILKEAAQISKE